MRHKAGIPKFAGVSVGKFTQFCFQPHHRNRCSFFIYLHDSVSIAFNNNVWLR